MIPFPAVGAGAVCRHGGLKRDCEPRDLNDRLDDIQELVEQQAEDERLWSVPRTAAEAYLQQELRRLHAKIEENTQPMVRTVKR